MNDQELNEKLTGDKVVNGILADMEPKKLKMTYTDADYMAYLDEMTGIDGYGLLLWKGDAIAFEIGLREHNDENS